MARIVLIGAGSAVFGYNSLLDSFNIPTLNNSELVLHDLSDERLSNMTKLAQIMKKETNSKISISSTIKRKEALNDADFIVIAIAIDRMNRWRLDWEIPFKHGIKQVIGENGGPGGLFHTLRNIPPILDICYDIEEICPDALLINYTNPVSRIGLAISRYTEVNSIGLCHEVEHQMQRLSKLMEIPTSLFQVISSGLNHFSWYNELRLKDGTDAYPLLTKALEDSKNFQPLCQAMFRKFGLYPSTDDNHLGEYLAYAWDLCPPEIRGLSWIERCERQGNLNWNRVQNLINANVPLDVKNKQSGERAMHIISGLISNSNHVELQVNLPNEGQVNNLIQEAIVETPAIINKGGIKPIHVGGLPEGLAALCNIQILVQSLTIEAAVRGDKDLAYQAMLIDPVVNDTEAAEQAFQELLSVHSDLLPQFG